MKRILLVTAVACSIFGILTSDALPDSFEAMGLYPGACIVSDKTLESFTRARKILKANGARVLQGFPPDVIYGQFPSGLSESDFDGLAVRIARSPSMIGRTEIDAVAHRAVTSLFNGREALVDADLANAGPLNDMTLRVPDDIRERYKGGAVKKGSPLELQDRGINQNAEFMIGSVLINIILPESNGGSENWTDDEISGVIFGISAGVAHYQNNANWAGIDFYFNYRDYTRVPVSSEPIMGDWNTDYIWMGQCLEELGYDRSMWASHHLNNDMRARFGTDWVFTAFIVDASENECWQGPEGFYVAYSYLGGPLLLCPYPACRFGTGIGFEHVFIHEMSHTFWALDEYASAGVSCSETGGYLAVENGNSYAAPMGQTEPCGEGLDCIMNNAPLQPGLLPICPYTLGQVGLADVNMNSIPDIYEVAPTVEFLDLPGVVSDTIVTSDYLFAARARNSGVPNRNPNQGVSERINYTPWLIEGKYAIGDDLFQALNPSDGNWDESSEDIGFFMTGLEPGVNTLTLTVKNHVSMTDTVRKDVYYVGIKYYRTSAVVRDEGVDLSWITALEVFGSEFEVIRSDITVGNEDEIIAIVTEPEDVDEDSRYYTYRDEDITPGHEYRYRIMARFQMEVGGKVESFSYPSRYIYETIGLPVASGLVSTVLPNPTTGRTTFTVMVPKTFDHAGDVETSRGSFPGYRHQSGLEEKTPVKINIYNVKGALVNTLYDRPRYGGELTMTWDGTDKYGKAAAPGVYFLRVKAGNSEQSKKIIVIR